MNGPENLDPPPNGSAQPSPAPTRRRKSTSASERRPDGAGEPGVEPGREQTASGAAGGSSGRARRWSGRTIRPGSSPNPSATARANATRPITSGTGRVDDPRPPLLGQRHGRAGDVGAVARVRDLVGRADQLLAGRERADELVGEVLPLPLRAEHPDVRSVKTRSPSASARATLGLELGAAVGRERVDGRVLGVRAVEAVEDVIGGEVDEPRPEFGGGPGEVQGCSQVGGAGAGRGRARSRRPR